jgi:DNA-binding NarL/FixJ family response regulator
MINICIVDPYEISRLGLAMLLEQQEDFRVTGVYSCASSWLQQLSNVECDIVIVSVFIPEIDGTSLLLQVHTIKPSQKIIFLALKGIRSYAKRLANLCQPVFCIEEQMNCLMKLIRNVHCKLFISTQTGDFIRNKNILPLALFETSPTRVLTKREIEILCLIYTEQSNKDIAHKLFLSIGTIETHRKRIKYKLGAKNTVGIIKYVAANNLFPHEV